ncbi:MAG: (2Fe-2S)-binding protein, partial [Conexibacter sp.]
IPAAPRATDLDELVCSCQAVPRRTIASAIREHGLRSAEQVGRHTRAGTGCGGCRPRIETLIGELEADAVAELRETV